MQNDEWIIDDGDTSRIQDPLHTFYTSDKHQVTLRAYTDLGCYGDTTGEVELLITPQAGFSVNDVCYGEEVDYVNTSHVASGDLTYSWEFGDGNTSTMESPIHTYVGSGSYRVRLLATGTSGCEDELIDTVVVNEEIMVREEVINDTLRLDVSGGSPFDTGMPYHF